MPAFKHVRDGSNVDGHAGLTDKEFEEIKQFILDVTGISMNNSKRELILRRLRKRLHETGCTTVREYLDLLRHGNEWELEQFVNAITTNLTSFFREPHHFDYLAEVVIPEIIKRKTNAGRRLRIWSAGCSTGEEPYSIAITLSNFRDELRGWDAKVLCTDLDSDVLSRAAAGKFTESQAEKLPAALVKKWFQLNRGEPVTYSVRSELGAMLTFNQLNLMASWPMKGKFDVIFCRNVMIYFNKDTQRRLVERFANALEQHGHLVLGHSESLFGVTTDFKLVGHSIYRKIS